MSHLKQQPFAGLAQAMKGEFIEQIAEEFDLTEEEAKKQVETEAAWLEHDQEKREDKPEVIVDQVNNAFRRQSGDYWPGKRSTRRQLAHTEQKPERKKKSAFWNLSPVERKLFIDKMNNLGLRGVSDIKQVINEQEAWEITEAWAKELNNIQNNNSIFDRRFKAVVKSWMYAWRGHAKRLGVDYGGKPQKKGSKKNRDANWRARKLKTSQAGPKGRNH